jgi:hypothetical protein
MPDAPAVVSAPSHERVPETPVVVSVPLRQHALEAPVVVSAPLQERAPETPVVVSVPLHDTALEPPAPERVRRLRRHLIEAMRALREAKRPDRLIPRATAEPEGFTAEVLRAGCATCQGFCCKGGGEHAYIDERTMAHVRRDRPELDARQLIRCYLDALAPLSYAGSCLFHGAQGCTLPRSLRAELCNSYYCDGLRDFQRRADAPAQVVVVAARNGTERRSAVLRRAD